MEQGKKIEYVNNRRKKRKKKDCGTEEGKAEKEVMNTQKGNTDWRKEERKEGRQI